MQSPFTPAATPDTDEQKRQLLTAAAKQRQSFDAKAPQQEPRATESITRRFAQRGVKYSALND